MADLVETVARAMWFDHVDRQGYPNSMPTWDEMVEHEGGMHEVEDTRSNARAAIAASVPKVWQAMLAQYRKEMLGD